jgi:ribosomal protein S18 acetylase RimI-like enzyme
LIRTPVSIVVRPASESDYPAIARIQQRCAEAAQWPVGDYSGFNVLIALADAVAAGFCAWRQTSSDEAELLNLGVEPACRRKGVAAALLRTVSEYARGEIFLEVAATNPGAIALYERQGWVRLAIRRGYYDSGRTDAVVMKKPSC